MRRRRGFALADFVAGTMVFTGVLGGFAAMTRAKFQTLEAAQARSRALAAAEELLDRVRRDGLDRAPQGNADTDGFRLVRKDDALTIDGRPVAGLGSPALRIDARALRLTGAREDDHLLEVRVRITWQDGEGGNQLDLCTVAPRRAP